jgi:Fic family protein
MNPEVFVAPAAGRVVKTPEGYWAFVPAPLPPQLEYDAEFVRQLSRADAALSELSGLGRLLPNPHLLIAPWIRREAVLSSRIEGTRTTLNELLIEEAGATPAGRGDDADLREVLNYVAALEYGIARLRELPLSLRLVRELHERLMKGVRGDRATPGEFRRSQNWIGPGGSTPVTATYVPPPVAEMHPCLDAWETFLHVRDALPDLVQCALVHEQFEAIHPFLDGNGRVGRLLITLFLIERGRLSQPLLYLSSYIDAHRNDYYDLLQRVRTHGDWISWLRYFVTGVYETATDAIAQTARLLALRERYRRDLPRSPRAQLLVDALFTNPYITAKRAQEFLGTSNPTARATLALLERHGIVRELTGRQWGRLYFADEVLAAIESR